MLHKEIVEACNLEDQFVIDYVRIVETYGIAYGEEEYEGGPSIILVNEERSGRIALADFREFCARTKTPLAALVENLQFDLLG